jgi:hypothetical protein
MPSLPLMALRFDAAAFAAVYAAHFALPCALRHAIFAVSC